MIVIKPWDMRNWNEYLMRHWIIIAISADAAAAAVAFFCIHHLPFDDSNERTSTRDDKMFERVSGVHGEHTYNVHLSVA